MNIDLLRFFISMLFSLVIGLSLPAQTSIEYFDVEWTPCVKEDATFYREIAYDENGKPLGKVRDYWVTGELQFEGQLHSSNPDSLDGVCTWYYRNGHKEQEAFFVKDSLIGKIREWSFEGKEEGVLDESGRFFSEEYLLNYLNEINPQIKSNLDIDSSTVILLIRTGLLLLSKNDFNSSILSFQIASDIAFLIKKKILQGIVFNNIGGLYDSQGKFEEALIWYFKAKGIRKSHNLESDLSTTYNNIGSTYHSQGKYNEALSSFNNAKNIQEKLGLEKKLVLSYNNISQVYLSQGQYEEALHWLYKVNKVLPRFNQESDLATNYNNIGGVFNNMGKHETALIWFDKARKIREQLNNPIKLTHIYNNIGSAYHSQAKYEEAIFWYMKAKEIQKKYNKNIELSYAYNNLGSAYYNQGNYQEALIWHKKAIDILIQLNMEVELSNSYNNIGLIYSDQEKHEQAFTFYNKAIAIQKRIGLFIDLSISYNNIGSTYIKQHDLENAIIFFNKAKEIQEDYNLEIKLFTTYNNLAFTFFFNSQLDSALHYSKKYFRISESLRESNKGKSNRHFYIDKSLVAMEIGISSGYKLRQASMAFEFSEKGKARRLSDLLAAQSIELLKIPVNIRTTYKKINNQLSFFNLNLSKELPNTKRKNLIKLRDSIFLKRQELEDHIKIITPEHANLIYPKTVDMTHIQSILLQDEILISYFTGQKKYSLSSLLQLN